MQRPMWRRSVLHKTWPLWSIFCLASPLDLFEIAVYYYYVDKMKHEEIAELLGVSRRTIGNRLTRFGAAKELVETDEKKRDSNGSV